jgi:hypothetical protein
MAPRVLNQPTTSVDLSRRWRPTLRAGGPDPLIRQRHKVCLRHLQVRRHLAGAPDRSGSIPTIFMSVDVGGQLAGQFECARGCGCRVSRISGHFVTADQDGKVGR